MPDNLTTEQMQRPLMRISGRLFGEQNRFMFMHRDDAGRSHYKHADTRSYLVLDEHGTAYGPRQDGTLTPIAIDEAVRAALGGFHPDADLGEQD